MSVAGQTLSEALPCHQSSDPPQNAIANERRAQARDLGLAHLARFV